MAREKSIALQWIVFLFFFATITALEIDIYRHTGPSKFTNEDRNESITLLKYMNGEYYSLINVGSPAKEFKVTFDTAWADSWLPSQHCGLLQIACMMHTRYDSSKSSSYKPDGRIYSRGNSEMSLSGFLSTDDFHLSHMAVVNQTFVEITKMSDIPFLANKADGIIGLGFISLSVKGTLPFFYNYVKQKGAPQVFTFYMNRHPDTPKAGKLLLGATDRSHVKGNFTHLPVIEKKFWMVYMDKVEVDNKKDKEKPFVFCENGCNATFDTGTNLIRGPADQIMLINNLLHAKLIGQKFFNRYMVDCKTFAELPHISFIFAGKEHTIESKYYIQDMTWFGFTLCLTPFVANSDSKDNSWMLGGAFLMQYYSEFDFQNGRVSLAETVY